MSFNSNNLNESLLSYGMSQSEVASFMKDYDQLTDSDKSLFIYETLGKDIYKTYPVDMHTFIHDPYYLGTIVFLLEPKNISLASSVLCAKSNALNIWSA